MTLSVSRLPSSDCVLGIPRSRTCRLVPAPRDCLFLSLRCFLHELSTTSDFHWALFLRIMGLAAYHAHVAQRPVFNITSIVASTTFTNLASLCRARLNCRRVRCLAWSVMLPGRQRIRQECRAVHPPGATSPWSYFSTCLVRCACRAGEDTVSSAYELTPQYQCPRQDTDTVCGGEDSMTSSQEHAWFDCPSWTRKPDIHSECCH